MATAISASAACAAAAVAPAAQVRAAANVNASTSLKFAPLNGATWSRTSARRCRQQVRLAVSAGLRQSEAQRTSEIPQAKAGIEASSVLAAAALSFLSTAGSAAAAQEIMQIADVDARPAILAVLLVAAVGWVLFNIGGPALSQVNKMRGLKGVAGAVGLTAAASMLLAPEADAAQEIAQLAVDSRPLILVVVLGPAVGWVLFNILRPALNQFTSMQGGGLGGKKRAFAGALGLGAASLLAAPPSEAAQEVYQVALDQRPLILLLPVVAAAGWVLFNIAVPALNQVQKMIGNQQAKTRGRK